ncbi:hypothetical protein EJ04DRAFT_575373 [Polyplosphaeria fusca]|uniref:NB-ARC domain-containing protein n=1 Tax=Polyplosphaeria fusca TaxID=682080 RepID=A0A9P4R3S9_9PLEO|nr:hypothetical protein EJ04DRAFT_575373 [Polyplosphaeria fusca]
MSGMVIADTAEKCKAAFVSLVDCTRLSRQAELAEAVEDEQAKFNIWAAHIGVFASYHSSLDYRLRESEVVKPLVIAQLAILNRSQIHLSESIQDDDAFTSRANEVTRKQRRLSALPDRARSEDVDDDFTSDLMDDRDNEETINSIKNAVERLHRLAKEIRRPGLESSATKAKRFRPVDDDGFDEIELFEDFSRKLIARRFENCEEFLRERLSRCNADRRQLFLYRRKHQDILYGKVQKPKARRPSVNRRQTQNSNSAAPEAKLSNVPSQMKTGIPKVFSESNFVSTVAKATSFAESKFQADRPSEPASSRVGTSVASSVDRSRLPPPPSFIKTGNDFECPYCCQLIAAKMVERKRWKQHLLKDIESYVCLFPDCPESQTRYRDQNTWIAHLRTHTRRWICRLPGHPRGGPPQSFDSIEEYSKHLTATHSGKALSQNQMHQLLKLQRPVHDPNPLKKCPLCAVTLEELGQTFGLAGSNPGATGLLPSAALTQKMQKHIVSHLIWLASYSLPWLDEADGNFRSDEASSAVTEKSDCTDPEEPAAPHRTGSRSNLSADTEPLVFEDSDDMIQPRDEHEWDFVNPFDYQGQEFDDVLYSFVRKYHVDMAFTENNALELTLPCIHMPLSRNQQFFNRENAITYLDRALDGTSAEIAGEGQALTNSQLRTCALYGPSGIGKSQVAVEWTYRNMSRFDAVFWIHADEDSKMSEDINRIAVRLGLVDARSADSADQVLTRELFKRWLGDPTKSFIASTTDTSKARWLLVLDHVIDASILDGVWPINQDYGSILITSRRHLPQSLPIHHSFTIEPFTPLDGAGLMCSLLPDEASSEARQCASIISSKVKGKPYALSHLTKWILRERLTFEEFLSQNFESENSTLQQRMQGELSRFVVDEEHSFLEAAFDSLKISRTLLDVLSMLDPDTIPMKILNICDSHISISGYPSTESSLHQAIQELLRFGLITESQKVPSTFLIARIVQEATRKLMTPEYARDVFDTCLVIISAQWPFNPFTWRHGTGRWPQCEELFPHVMRLRRIAPSITTTNYDLHCGYQYARLWCDCGWYCHERGRLGEAEAFSSIAQNICEEVKKQFPLWSSSHQSELPSERAIDDTLAETIHNRGVIAVEVHKPKESLEYHLRFNSMMISELDGCEGGTDMRLALSFNELGCAYMLHEDYAHAEDCFNSSVDRMKRLECYEPWLISLPGVNLGALYLLTDRYEEAEQELLQGLRERERKFGYNDRESFITGRFLYTLGNVYDAKGDYDTSLEYHQRALNHYRNILGSGHHRFADTLIRMGRHFIRMRQTEKALELIEQAIQVYGFDDAWKAELARAHFWKSKALRCKGDARRADDEYNKSCAMYWDLDGQEAAQEPLDVSDFNRHVTFWTW